MAKKANGEGSVQKYYKNGEYKGWRATITAGRNEQGKLIRKQFYGKTKLEVLNKMNEYREKHNKGLIASNENITLTQWFKIWLFEFKANELKSSTIERYDIIYRNYIKNSPIASIKLKDLKAPTIQVYYNMLNEEGKSAYSIKMLHKVLKSSLEHAKKINYIPLNYCDNVVTPKVTSSKEVEIFSLDEQKKFITSLEGHKYRIIFILVLGTGLRIGEVVALKWSDINLDSSTLKITKAITRSYEITNDKRVFKLKEETPKTPSSIREVPIPSNILKELKAHKEHQEKLKNDNKDLYIDNDYVFTNKLGDLILPDTLSKSYNKALKDAKIAHKKFHALRHTYATRLFEKSIPLKTVQELLGHSSIKITADIYTHVMPNEKVKAVEKINDLFQ